MKLVRAMGERHSAHLAVLKSKIESLELAEKNTSSAVKALVEQDTSAFCGGDVRREHHTLYVRIGIWTNRAHSAETMEIYACKECVVVASF